MNTKEVSHFESLYPAESRYEEIEKVLRFIKHGDSCQVVGLPGVGQSTFLKLLAYNKNVRVKHLGEEQEQYHFVLINFSEIRKRPLVDVTKFMLLSLLDSLRGRGMQVEFEKTNAIFKEAIALNDELVMFQGLKNTIDLLALERDLAIVLLLDRFEEYIPTLTDDFFQNLRVLRIRTKHKFSVVFSLNRLIEESIEPSLMVDYSEYLTNHIVYLGLMDKPVLDFRIKQLEELSGKTLDAALRGQILSLAGGFGRLSKNCVQLVLNNGTMEQLNNLSTFLLSQPSIQNTLYDIWQTLTPSEQDFLLSNTAYAEPDHDYPYLANIGLLRDGKITIPLLQTYLQQSLRTLDEKTKNDPIRLDPNTNEIKQGNDVISDRLTSAEFRLLRFLIEHERIVVDRESIITAVWSDAKSSAGVTDQALDQLLFRIRHKLEDDPNNPQHIQTVKGRGVRFVS